MSPTNRANNSFSFTLMAKRFLPIDESVTVDNYPYGFNLRTSITYSVERKPGNGMRSVSQTVNPKTGKPNKPKHSTYSAFVRLYEDTETGYIHFFHYNPYDAKGYDEAVRCGAFEGVPESVYPFEKVERSRIIQCIKWICAAQFIFEGETPLPLPKLTDDEYEVLKNGSIEELQSLETKKQKECDESKELRPAHIY